MASSVEKASLPACDDMQVRLKLTAEIFARGAIRAAATQKKKQN